MRSKRHWKHQEIEINVSNSPDLSNSQNPEIIPEAWTKTHEDSNMIYFFDSSRNLYIGRPKTGRFIWHCSTCGKEIPENEIKKFKEKTKRGGGSYTYRYRHKHIEPAHPEWYWSPHQKEETKYHLVHRAILRTGCISFICPICGRMASIEEEWFGYCSLQHKGMMARRLVNAAFKEDIESFEGGEQ